uniref:Uncharacterized protein n=1 Tax=Cacopsylla melanoneura TaxID=428564 RepID=A0A8D8SLE9_9HEMI
MIYDGYKYRFSTPLSVKGGKNWCCTVVKCRGYLKTEMSLGELVLIPVRKHSHPRVSLKRQSNTVESDKDKREDKPVDDTIPVNKSLTPSPFTSQIVESNVGQNSNDSNYQTWTPLLSNVYNTDTILLPQTYSVQSVGLTPNTSNNPQTNTTCNETPQLTLSVKKLMEIDRLQAKSDADEKLLADLVEHITELESKHTEAKDRINSLEYQIALRDACSCGPAPRLEYALPPANQINVTKTVDISKSKQPAFKLSKSTSNNNKIRPTASNQKTIQKTIQGKSKPASNRRQKSKKPNKQQLQTLDRPHHISRDGAKPGGKLVIVSDSMGRGLSSLLQSMLPSTQVTGFVYPNAKFNDVIQRAAAVSADLSRDDYLLVLAGTNNTSQFIPNSCLLCNNPYGTSTDPTLDPCFTATNTMNLLKERTNLVVCAIPYRYDVYKYQNSNINHLNKYLHNKCTNLGIKFMTVQSHLRRSHYTSHGLHFNKIGKQMLSERIKGFISSFPSGSPVPAPAIVCSNSGVAAADITSASAPGPTATLDNDVNQDIADITCPTDLVEISTIDISSPEILSPNANSNDSSLFFLNAL